VRITHEPALGPDRFELLVAAGDELVRIDLVPGVPDESVLREVEAEVQGEAQLDDAEVAGEVSGADAEHAHQLVAHLLRELQELCVVKLLQVGGMCDGRQQLAHELLLTHESVRPRSALLAGVPQPATLPVAGLSVQITGRLTP